MTDLTLYKRVVDDRDMGRVVGHLEPATSADLLAAVRNLPGVEFRSGCLGHNPDDHRYCNIGPYLVVPVLEDSE